jgi:hypothetical protein
MVRRLIERRGLLEKWGKEEGAGHPANLMNLPVRKMVNR